MAKAVILGGGISGLSSAFYALQEGTHSKFSKVVLLEASDRFGGWLHSTKFQDNTVFEHGPRSFRATTNNSSVNSVDLALRLGLHKDIIVALKGSEVDTRFIYKDQTLHELPKSLKPVFNVVPPFTKRLIWSFWQDIITAKGTEDESIHSFLTRRFGQEIADYLGDAFVRGIYAGDSKTLSIRSTLVDLYNWEQRKNGFGRIFQVSEPPNPSPLLEFMKKWSVWSLRGGCQQLPDTLVEHLSRPHMPAELHLNSPCTQLTFKDGAALVTSEEGEITADHVFSSIYAADLADILPEEHSELAEELEAIPAVSVIVVNLEYPIESPVKGFGHLLPSCEDRPILGVVYDSCTFPEHDSNIPDKPVSRFTVMMGGAWYDELVKERLGGSLDPSRVARLATEVISKHLGIIEAPVKIDMMVHADCIPQYLVGHNERVERIFKYIKDNNLPLSLVGSSYKGVSVNDCIYNAKLRVEHFTGPIPFKAPDIQDEHFLF
ncbi:protoporphyrinogen oxidase-like [Mizuhopecten yessoensis]|uniref:protoporphyrinogen oxidase-like n=1 Tax=Mizuhopecten yessoensis TaxID=6573 RepID=UPI000B45B138|nr:protoporphyrinogen oxidase-like [Mizuhopecten yessoensis]